MQKWIQSLIAAKKIGFLGAGNLSKSIIQGLTRASVVPAENIILTNRNAEKRQKIASEIHGVQAITSNEELLEKAGIIVLGVKPQDLVSAIEPIRHLIHKEHIIISLAAGVSIEALSKLIPTTKNLIRWMPSTAMKVQASVTAYTTMEQNETLIQLSEDLLNPLGLAIQVEEGEELNSIMVACASGPAFIYEFMQIWESWLESYDIPQNIARKLCIQTFLGSAKMAQQAAELNLHDLQNQVMSKKGVTSVGIQHLRSVEFEDLLTAAFEKSFNRAKDMEQDFEMNLQQIDKK